MKDPTLILLASWFFGVFGVDRFLLGDVGGGILKIVTFWIISPLLLYIPFVADYDPMLYFMLYAAFFVGAWTFGYKITGVAGGIGAVLIGIALIADIVMPNLIVMIIAIPGIILFSLTPFFGIFIWLINDVIYNHQIAREYNLYKVMKAVGYVQ